MSLYLQQIRGAELAGHRTGVPADDADRPGAHPVQRGARAGTASGVFNTSRQLGGALAVAVSGALLTTPAGFLHGPRTSLLIAAVVVLAAAAASPLLAPDPTPHGQPDIPRGQHPTAERRAARRP